MLLVLVHPSRTFCSMSTELRAVPQLSCSSSLCLQQTSKSTFTFCSRFQQKLLCKHRLTFCSRPACKISFSRSPWYKTSQRLFSQLLSRRSSALGMLSYRLSVLYLTGMTDRLPCFGTYDASRFHIPMLSSLHGTKASTFVLPISFRSL